MFGAFKAWLEDRSGAPRLIRRLLVEYGYDQAPSYAFAIGLGAVAAACTAGTAYLVGTVVNEAYVTRDFGALSTLAFATIVLFAVKGLAMYGSSVTMARISYRIVADIQRRIFDKLLIEGIGYFSDRHSTEFLARMTRGARAAATVLQQVVNSLGRDLLTLIGLATVMIVQDPIMSAIGLLIMPPAVYLVRGLMRRARNIARSELGGALQIFETIQETLRGFPIVKAFTLEEEMRRRLEGFIASVEQRQYKLAAIENRASPIMESLGGVAIALVLLYGGYRVIETGATPGEFVSFITAFLLAYEPAKRIARLNISLSRLMMGVRDLFEILDSPPTELDEPGLEPAAGIERAELRFIEVHFKYVARKPALRGLSFVAEAGKMTALVGESGSGKSTAVALILRFYDPSKGRIEIDGRDIKQFPRRALRRQIAYVGQDVFLFRGTIRENIAFGKLGASDEEIFAAARAAYAHDFIMSFPDGYDTAVGEAGAKLSSGQRQRIAVARALIRDAKIILLDEATSSLDVRTEHEVQLAIDRLREGRTCIAIAHRLNTVTQASCIHVLEHGRIVESGTHDELLTKDGIYAGMYRLQSRERAVEAVAGAGAEYPTVAPVAAK